MPYGEKGQTQEHRSSTQSSNKGARHHTGGDQSNIAADKANYQRAVRDLQGKGPDIRDHHGAFTPKTITPTIKKPSTISKWRKDMMDKRLWASILQDREDLEDLAKGPGEGAMHMGFKGFDPKEEYDLSGLKSIQTEFKDPSKKGDILYPSESKLPGMFSVVGNMFQPKATKEGALNTLNRITQAKEFLDKGMTQSQYNEFFPGPDKPTDGGGEGGQIPWWLRQQGPVASTDTTTPSTDLGGLDFQVPLKYVVGGVRAADGGMIGSVGGISRPKYQGGNMVGAEIEGAEIEGAEMEGAVMQSQEVIKELYDALIAQGLSPQEAMEKIKEIIASSQAEGPQSPMMGEEFPGQEFGRAPAAFGGIMDTYTGRRKYGLGSFIKKAVKKVKKLAGSKLGKLALMYAAGTYLGGTAAFGGAGTQTFAQRLADPKLLANLLNPTGGGLGEGTGWSMFKGAPAVGANTAAHAKIGASMRDPSLFAKGIKALKNPWVSIPLASAAAGLYTAQQPEEDLDDSMSEWKRQKADMDRYLANLGSYEGGDYRVPKEYRAAQGGRIGYGLGSWVKGALGLGKKEGSAEADPGVVSTQDPDVMREKLLDYFKAKYSGEGWTELAAQGGRIGRQEGGLMDLGGMEKDYRNDGGFVPLGGEEKADDVPARLSRNEFVFTADAVKNAGGGDIDRGAEVMENVMKNLEGGGQISEESQGQGAQEMFETSERLSEVI